jgi:DNA polymerase-3 subunit delta
MAAAQKRATRSPASAGPTWRDVTPAAVVLVSGPEEYLGIRAMDKVRAEVRAAAPDVEVSRINAASYEAGSLLMQVSPSLFGESKLIEVEAVESMNDAFLADALAYIGHPEPDAVLVLRHGGGVRGKKLLDAIKKGGWPVVDCQPLKKDADKVAFVASEFKTAGRRIEQEAVQALVNAVGANLSELAAACSQLIADAGTTVTTDIVDRYYGGRIEATAFKVADAAMAGNGPLALSTLRHALATGADPVPLVAALAAKLRTVARVAGASGS